MTRHPTIHGRTYSRSKHSQHASDVMRPFSRLPQPGNPQSGTVGAVYWSSTATVELYPFDQEYLARLQAHDAPTEAHFVNYFSKLLKAKLHSDGYSESALNDILQETLYRVLKAVYDNKIQNPTSLRSFVYGVCDRVEWEYDRGEWRLWQNDSEEFPEIPDDRNPSGSPARQAEVRQAALWVLNKMPEKDRKILVAVFMDEKEREDICQEFGITRDNLRVLLHRALTTARTILARGATN